MSKNPILSSRFLILPALAVGLAVIATGCGQKESSSPTAQVGPTAPPAAPNSNLSVNNPPPGQPNHMTPEMQAQIERYRSMGKK